MVSNTPLESWEQEYVIKYCDVRKILNFAIPNGTHIKSHAGRAKAHREGLKKGVPDMMVAVANKDYHGLLIEMKRAKKSLSTVSPSQRKWNIALNKNGYYAVICYGHTEAIQCIDMYLSNTLPEQKKEKIHEDQSTIYNFLK